jgi:hypothetical protein
VGSLAVAGREESNECGVASRLYKESEQVGVMRVGG